MKKICLFLISLVSIHVSAQTALFSINTNGLISNTQARFIDPQDPSVNTLSYSLGSAVSVTAGMGVTEFQFGGQTVYVRDGMCVNADGVLAGSMLAMMQAVRNGVTRIGWEPAEVLRMASLYPARIMGVSDRLGILTAGAVANLALFHPHTYDMVAVVEQGRLRMLR